MKVFSSPNHTSSKATILDLQVQEKTFNVNDFDNNVNLVKKELRNMDVIVEYDILKGTDRLMLRIYDCIVK
ncbi:MAG: hypothetical protein FH758_14580 [Firmicutes bacterium]|nr:hypothetical protein [Bacillota bacterium]